MINPKENLREYLDQLIHRFLNIKSLYQELSRIHDWYVPTRVETINLSSYFFQLSSYSMSRIFLVELSMLLSKDEDRSLFDWLKKAHEHAPSIGPTRYNPKYSKGEREPIKAKEYRGIIDKHTTQLESQKDVVEKIKARRDKAIAHLDKTYFEDPLAVNIHYPIYTTEIDQLIEIVSDVLRQHYKYLFQADMRMEILSPMNVDVILTYARAFKRVREDSALIKKGFKPIDYMREDYHKENDG
jgi:hypothetical protein